MGEGPTERIGWIPRIRRGLARRARNLWTRIRYHDAHWFLSPWRRRTRALLARIPGDGPLEVTGNYYLDSRKRLGPDAVVYSFGVLTNIDFDEAVAARFGCPVHLFDPTPTAIEFMAAFEGDPRYVFHPVGVWTEDAELEFHVPLEGGSASCVFDGDAPGGFTAECRTVARLMAELGHDHLDVVKMDIEGAALPVLEKMFEDGILPTQVVVELERPASWAAAAQEDWFARMDALLAAAAARGYRVWALPRERYRWFSVELLLSRDDPGA